MYASKEAAFNAFLKARPRYRKKDITPGVEMRDVMRVQDLETAGRQLSRALANRRYVDRSKGLLDPEAFPGMKALAWPSDMGVVLAIHCEEAAKSLLAGTFNRDWYKS